MLSFSEVFLLACSGAAVANALDHRAPVIKREVSRRVEARQLDVLSPLSAIQTALTPAVADVLEIVNGATTGDFDISSIQSQLATIVGLFSDAASELGGLATSAVPLKKRDADADAAAELVTDILVETGSLIAGLEQAAANVPGLTGLVIGLSLAINPPLTLILVTLNDLVGGVLALVGGLLDGLGLNLGVLAGLTTVTELLGLGL